MKLIIKVHPETHEILNNAREAYLLGEITTEQMNDIVTSCIQAERERKRLGIPFAEPDTVPMDEAEVRAAVLL
jgi:hypothetical protein